MQKIFGGSKQVSDSQSSSTPVDMTPAEFQGLRGPLAEMLKTYISTEQVGPQYSGPLKADITQPETDLLGALQGQGQNRNALIQKTLEGQFLPGQSGANPFLEAAIQSAQRPTLQGLEETLSRSLPGRFTQAGQFVQPQGSSAFDRAAAIATRGAADAMKDIATNMSFAGYESERGRQQEAVQIDQAEVDTTIKNLQAQALPRLIEELGIERGLAMFQQNTQSILQILQTLAGVTAPTVANTQFATSHAEGSSDKGIFSQLFPKGIGGG
jgi:hypothetical protein